jgi:DNA-binding FadR family transcriptional regulator
VATPTTNQPSESLALTLARRERPRRPKTSERIARELANLIVDHDLQPGSRLPTEREMVESFGVGRTTLREALRLLETRGVITIRSGPHGGPVVRRPLPSDLSESLTLILQFEAASFADVVYARHALEPTAARLAARNIDAETLALLRETLAIVQSSDDQDVWGRENRRFHSAIAMASGNVPIRVFIETLISLVDGTAVGVRFPPTRRSVVWDLHHHIVDALEAGDEDAAEKAMRAHNEEGIRYFEEHHAQLMTQPVRWVH